MSGSPLFEKLKNNEMTPDLENEIWQEFGVERATVVIDSSGFSRVTRAKGILYFLSLVTQMREVVEKEFAEHGALRTRFEADNAYGEFETVDQAFKAVVAANKALKESNIMLFDDEPYAICTGIGFGRLLDGQSEGLYGDQMNIASKLGEDTADAREILMTEEAFAKLSEDLKEGFKTMDTEASGVDIHYYQYDC